MKTLPALLLLLTAPILPASPDHEPQEPSGVSTVVNYAPDRLIVIDGYLLRVIGDEVRVLWIHPKAQPWKGFDVAPGVDMSR